MKQTKKIISLFCIITLLLSLCTFSASANSVAPYWEGTSSSGVVTKEGDVPIVVEGELLTFDLPTLPYAKYRDSETFLAYDSKVTAEYTFYNPTDMTITATLFFPFDSHPDYSKASASEVLEKYGVYVNDEKIDARIRHTNYLNYDGLAVNELIATLSDEFLQDDFYTPDLTVTKYSYEVVGHSDSSAYFSIGVDDVGTERKIVVYKGNLGGYINNSNGVFMSSDPNRGKTETAYFYVFGKPLDVEPSVGWYKHSSTNSEMRIDGEFHYLGTETTTLREFIFSEYDAEKGISEVDWYNACITRIQHEEKTKGTASLIFPIIFNAPLRWYEYTIVLAPGERIKNTVVSPMYPSIDAGHTPYEYHYTYLLSPASCWANFGKLDIVINTPYEMSECSIEGFEKTETGYKLSMEGLPKDEDGYMDLHFTLLNDGNTPKEQPRAGIFKVIGNFFANIFRSVVDFVIRLVNRIPKK